MRKNKLYRHINICNVDYLIPFGQAAANQSKAFRINETGVFIWGAIDSAHTVNSLIEACMKEYEWDEESKAKYAPQLKAYVDMLWAKSVIEDGGNTCLVSAAEVIRGDYSENGTEEHGSICIESDDKEKDNRSIAECSTGSRTEARGDEDIQNALFNGKTRLNIAGIEIEINVSEELLPETFTEFVIQQTSQDALDYMTINVQPESGAGGENSGRLNAGKAPDGQLYARQGSLGQLNDGQDTDSHKIIETDEVRIFEAPDSFELIFLKNKYVKKVFVTNSGREAVVTYDSASDGSVLKEFAPELSVAIRMCFLILAQEHNMLALHSASVLFDDKAILFSAPSQTGKSTQARLWCETFGARQINGDFNLLHPTEKGIEVLGTPWCGSSGICEKGTHSLGFISFLKQAAENVVVEKTEHEKALSIINRSFSPTWTEEMLLKSVDIATRIAEGCDMCEFRCLPDKTAAECLKERIEI